MAGPPSMLTVSAALSPGCAPNVTSTAIAAVGSMPYAPVTAPAIVVSSCTVATA